MCGNLLAPYFDTTIEISSVDWQVWVSNHRLGSSPWQFLLSACYSSSFSNYQTSFIFSRRLYQRGDRFCVWCGGYLGVRYTGESTRVAVVSFNLNSCNYFHISEPPCYIFPPLTPHFSLFCSFFSCLTSLPPPSQFHQPTSGELVHPHPPNILCLFIGQ